MNVKLMEKLKSRLNLDARPLTFYTRGFNSNSDEVMSCDSTVRVSLKCPISMARQTIPVRTKKCQHLQTWDLQSFIEVMTESDKIKLYSDIFKQVKCPLCKINSTLVMDPIAKRLLTEFPAVDTLVIDHQGDARAALETDVSIINISDCSNQTINLITPEKGVKTESEDSKPATTNKGEKQCFHSSALKTIASNNHNSPTNPSMSSEINTNNVTKSISNAVSSSAKQTTSKSSSGAAGQINLDIFNDMIRLSKVKNNKGKENAKTVKIGDILQSKSKVKRLGEGKKRPLTVQVGSNVSTVFMLFADSDGLIQKKVVQIQI